MRRPQESRGGYSWIRSNVLGLVAIFIALSGSAVAAQVASNQSTTIVKTTATKQGAAIAKKKRGPRGPAGPQGPPGAAGLLSGPASGDLTGNYPSPQIAPEAVGPAETGSVPAAKVFNTMDATIPASTDTTLPFNSEFFDTSNMHAGSSGSLTAPITGLYLVEATVFWSGNASGLRQIRLAGDASGPSDRRPALASDPTVTTVSGVFQLLSGEEVHVVARHDSDTGNPTADGDFSMVWLGPAPPA